MTFFEPQVYILDVACKKTLSYCAKLAIYSQVLVITCSLLASSVPVNTCTKKGHFIVLFATFNILGGGEGFWSSTQVFGSDLQRFPVDQEWIRSSFQENPDPRVSFSIFFSFQLKLFLSSHTCISCIILAYLAFVMFSNTFYGFRMNES